MATYFHARWRHDETRKAYVFRDGHREAACDAFATGGTLLGLIPVPPLVEINADAEFEAIEIKEEAFEAIWQLAITDAKAAIAPLSQG